MGRGNWKVIEWIPYARFIDVKQISKGGFGTIHYARWIDGLIREWDIENQQWEIFGKSEVALKKFDNFVNLNDVLNEMEIHLKIYTKYGAVRFYGITQDLETHSYIEYTADGNLREYLKINFNNINLEQKLYNLYYLSSNLMDIHELDIVHQDFHPGNLLSSSFEHSINISDFGLSKLIGANLNNPEKKNIFGVLPYIAPEVLSELREELWKYCNDYYNKDSEIRIQIENSEQLSKNLGLASSTTTTPLNYQTHPQAIYTSRLLDFSKLPKPKNEENFESELEESTKSTSALSISNRLLDFSKLPKPKNEENFESELEESTKSTSALSIIASKLHVPDF
ncbi:hypothetical protein Glove_66g83 [Diversispora epigaea]|uniref:Protein kinase domain-containing protein n=1 Tax=Diversispora epigaea TaxID=1348612 RepID=A0A397JHJ9_9GLOM|nr:hypothetical protein Glove_66g83 [Diversispora epigaea]